MLCKRRTSTFLSAGIVSAWSQGTAMFFPPDKASTAVLYLCCHGSEKQLRGTSLSHRPWHTCTEHDMSWWLVYSRAHDSWELEPQKAVVLFHRRTRWCTMWSEAQEDPFLSKIREEKQVGVWLCHNLSTPTPFITPLWESNDTIDCSTMHVSDLLGWSLCSIYIYWIKLLYIWN